jgi:hypothetical protein
MKLPKIKMETVLTGGTIILGVAQMLLTNKKETSDRTKMKNEILEEVMNNIPKKD